MAASTLLIDSDIFVQLAGADVLEDSVTALGLNWTRCRRMPDLPGMLKAGWFNCSEAMKLKALGACRYVAAVEQRSGAREIKKLLLGAVDPGELLALAIMAEDRHALFLSGDLNWMRIVNKPRFQAVRALIAGRILCLETILAILVERYGAAKLIDKFGAEPQKYQTLKIIFSQGMQTAESDIREAINSYKQDRQRQFGEDFFYSAS